MTLLLAQTGGGSALASWKPLIGLMVLFASAVVALLAVRRESPLLRRIPDNLEHLTGIPGWAATTVGTALFGLLVAGEGFYSDVAWHVALGRDEKLFTAPHASIVIGLQLIFASAAVCVGTATITKVATPWRIGALRVPASAVPLGALGGAAVLGFPLDEVWHAAYGVDVTMWSPTHMLMILGAALTGVAAWLVLGEAGVRPEGGWGRGLHVAAALFTVLGLTAPLGEFAFGVPQFQQIFHPILVSVASAFAFVVIRLVHGRGWVLAVLLIAFAIHSSPLGGEGDGGPAPTRAPAIFLASALAVEVVALLAGTRRRLRFAVASGLAVGTVGLAGEWAWNLGAYQPWKAALLPDAVVLSMIGAVGAAVAGAAYARAVVTERGNTTPGPTAIPGRTLAVAGLAVVLVILLPLPREVGDVTAAMEVTRTSEGMAELQVTVTPPDAADDARWFQATAWQGGGLELRDLKEVAPGVFRTTEPLPVAGGWKSIVRLHRGGELMALPVYLSDDPDIGEREIPATDRRGPMEPETDYLLRETFEGNGWLAPIVYGLLALAAAVWTAAFTIAGREVATSGGSSGGRRRGPSTRAPVPA